MSDGATKRKRVRLLQRYLLNPPAKAATWAGLVPGYVIIETRGRKTGKLRHNVVGMRVDGDTGWVVAEHGRHAGYVINLTADPHVRVRRHGKWRNATAEVVADDDPRARLHSFGRTHEKVLQAMGTDLTTVRFTFT